MVSAQPDLVSTVVVVHASDLVVWHAGQPCLKHLTFAFLAQEFAAAVVFAGWII
jgi:hypothetical protein